MKTTDAISASRAALLQPLGPLERFVREYVELAGGVWDEVEPQVYDLLLDADPLRVTFDPEALPEHPTAQLASLGSPLIDRMLEDARRLGAHTVLYAGGLNAHPHDLAGRLRRAFSTAPNATIVPVSVRLCFFPQATYRFVATFSSDQKEQAALDVVLDLHSGREVRHLARLVDQDRLSGRPIEPLAEAPHMSLHTGFVRACRQVARSLAPLANQRRRELTERTGRQIERMQRYYSRMLDEMALQPQRGSDPGEAAARRQIRIDAIQRERMLRVAELQRKSALRVALALSHVQVLHLPKLLVHFDVCRPQRPALPHEAVFDLLTDAFEPMQASPDAQPTFDLG